MEDERGRRQWGVPAILLAFVLGVAAGYGAGLWACRERAEAEAKARFYQFVHNADMLGVIDRERLDTLAAGREEAR